MEKKIINAKKENKRKREKEREKRERERKSIREGEFTWLWSFHALCQRVRGRGTIFLPLCANSGFNGAGASNSSLEKVI